MATDPKLIKNWIQYLKNNQIVQYKSDPKTGKLNYTRPVTAQDLEAFLDANSNFDQRTIAKAIQTVVAAKSAPKQIANEPKKLGHEPGKLGHDDDVIDVDYKEVPPKQLAAPAQQEPEERQPKPHYKLKPGQGNKPRVAYRGLREEFTDEKGAELDEKDIEKIFDLLSSQQKVQQPTTQKQPQQKKEPPPEEVQAKKEENMNKLRRLVRDTMTPQQRKTLWRALND